VAVVNFGVVERSSREAWNRRNRETNRSAEEDQRRGEDERRRIEEATRAENERIAERNRAAEERERAARRTRIQNRWVILQIRHQLEANESTRRSLSNFLAFVQEYGE